MPSRQGPPGHAWIHADVLPMGFRASQIPAWNDRAQAVLWVGDTIRLVGTNGQIRAEAKRLNIEPLDLDGRIVLPGFVDAHTHFLHVGVKTTRPDLRGAKSKREALDRLAKWLTTHPGSQSIIGEGWDESEWPDAEPPTRDEVDAVIAQAAARGDGPVDRQVVLRRICGHVAVASSGALPAIRAHWTDEDAVNMDTGLLLEAPSLYLNEVISSTPEQLDQAVQDASAKAHELGVTAVGDYSQAPYRMALQRAAARGTLSVRTFSSIYVQQLEAEIGLGFRTGRPGLGPDELPAGIRNQLAVGGKNGPAAGAHEHFAPVPGRDVGDRLAGGRSPWLRDGGLKVFLDGSLGGRTAFLREPYHDYEESRLPKAGASKDSPDPHAGHNHGPEEGHIGPRGSRIWSDDQLNHYFGASHRNGIQVHAHAIGDGAIDQGLDAFDRLAVREDLEGAGWPVESLHETIAEAATTTGPISDLAKVPGQPKATSLRHRFEHYEIVHDDQIRRTASLGIVSSSQPNFVGEWSSKGGMYESRLGARYQVNNRFVAFKNAGISLAFGSDGMPFGPLVGLESALQHPDTSQRLTPEEAIWHYTTASAWAIHWEDAIGSLRPDWKADLVALEVRGLDSKPTDWKIRETVSGGIPRLNPN